MLTTKFVNETGEAFELKEGNAGVYLKLATLANGGHFNVSFDTNATYREYWVGSNAKGLFITISSDECSDNECIKIKPNNEVEKIPRLQHQTRADSMKSPSKRPEWWQFWRHSRG